MNQLFSGPTVYSTSLEILDETGAFLVVILSEKGDPKTFRFLLSNLKNIQRNYKRLVCKNY